jgi:dolichol-phosphate mannosyltransferase
MPKISVIIPCYYNEHNIPVTAKALLAMEKDLPTDTEIEYIMIDDGSKDKTFEALLTFQNQYPDKVCAIKLAKNSGSSNAVLAGMNYVKGDCCVVIAADLQDPPEIIVRLYQHWRNGYKLVLAQKSQREDSFMTRLISNTFHDMMRKFVLPQSPKGGFDLWLFDRQLNEEVLKMKEQNSYLPYLFIWLGYEYVSIPYTRKKREIGKSGWTLSKKIKSFIDSFVSFSFLPLRIISILGLSLGLIAMVYAGFLLSEKFINGIEVQGWTSIMVTLLFIGSFIMMSLGIIGEYLWRTLDAARNRPLYVIDKVLEN